MALAAPIEVATGAKVTGIDVMLVRSRVFRVSGRVTNAPATGRVSLVLRDSNNAGWRDFDLQTTTRNVAGDFEFRGIPPGSYQLNAGEAGRASIVVLASDVENVLVGLTPGAEVKLRIAAEGPDKPNLSEIGYFLTTDGRRGFMSSAPWETDRFTMRNVAPVHYMLKLNGRLLQQFYVKNARAGDADALADGLTVTGPGAIAIDVVLASDGGRVQGVVRDKNQQPVSGATVLLAPERRSRADLFKNVTSDQNGHYEFAAITPGNYKLFAWDDIEPKAWSDADFLKDYEKQGEKLVLEAEARATPWRSGRTRNSRTF
jgi:Carboxypeptidase regulatory-like domain